jgi:hypothetical protein
MPNNECQPVADTATVRVWSGTPRESYETILETELWGAVRVRVEEVAA